MSNNLTTFFCFGIQKSSIHESRMQNLCCTDFLSSNSIFLRLLNYYGSMAQKLDMKRSRLQLRAFIADRKNKHGLYHITFCKVSKKVCQKCKFFVVGPVWVTFGMGPTRNCQKPVLKIKTYASSYNFLILHQKLLQKCIFHFLV